METRDGQELVFTSAGVMLVWGRGAAIVSE
jgi:hypothetical protein